METERTSGSGEEELLRVSCVDYYTFARLSWETSVRYYYRFNEHYVGNYSFPETFLDDIRSHCSVLPVDLGFVVLLAFLWTSLRIWMSDRVFVPLANYYQLAPHNIAKVPESAWKFLFYSCTWLTSVYVLYLSGRYQYFNDPLSVWDNWSYGMPVPWDIYCIYLIQCSFYLHSVYATLYLDIWRKDSAVMLLHHFLTLTLIGFSYAARHHGVGALVLLLHDVTDVELEFTKLNVYFKNRGGTLHRLNDIAADLGFVAFASSWFFFRLYLYPLKVLYTGFYGAMSMGPIDISFIPMFNVMLWILLIMNTWWFHFILIFLYKVATGQMKELNDTREYEGFTLVGFMSGLVITPERFKRHYSRLKLHFEVKRIEAEAKLAAKRNAQNGSCSLSNGTESHRDTITNGNVVNHRKEENGHVKHD